MTKPRVKHQSLPAWIEENVRLPAGTAEPGPIKLYPYQRGIAAAIGDPKIERVSVLKSARIGYTALLTGALAHFVVREPSPILVLMPTEADCRDYMVSRYRAAIPRQPGACATTCRCRIRAAGSQHAAAPAFPRRLASKSSPARRRAICGGTPRAY